VVEVILNDEHLMSDMFTASEIALATIPMGLLETGGAGQVEVLVGGLGLGYTADAVLGFQSVASLTVVEYLSPLIEWHEAGLLPLGTRLSDDPRCFFVVGFFFDVARGAAGFDPAMPGRRFDGIFLDIDHSPDFHLNPSHADFYSDEGLARLSRSLKDGGIFALWSNDPPDEPFLARLASQFSTASAEEVVFHNPLLDEDCVQTVYVAIRS
ncbi:MAG: spermidine synthase, partial [Pseudomonadota bacterium]|nr:spermidine synthase [Pseudomonadota bacterium]